MHRYRQGNKVPGMSGYNPYQAPQAPTYQAHAPAPGPGQEVPGTIVESMRGSRGWIMFIAILTVIGAGFLVLGGLGVMVAADKMGLPSFFGVVYVFMAAVYVLPAVFMLRFAGAIKQLTETRSMDSLDQACARSRDFWRLIGIMTLVVMGLYFVGIFAVVALGVAGEIF